MTRIVQVANVLTPTPGGLPTVLAHLAQGYADAGHAVVQVLPGAVDGVLQRPWGWQVWLRAPQLPGTGYRLLTDVRRVMRTVATHQPDRLEVHDRTTLRPLGPWARRAGVPSLVVSHERVDRLLRQWLPAQLPLDRAADRLNAGLAADFDAVACTTSWAASGFDRLGLPVHRVPLGVDLERSRPDRRARPFLAGDRELLLVVVSRLSRGRRPDLAVEALRELLRRGRRARLVIAGEGRLLAGLQERAQGLPVVFTGHIAEADRLARLMSAADVVLAPGPGESFGLSALEALACGTPVVVNLHSALPEVVGDAGLACPSSAFCLANAVEELLTIDEPVRRSRSRRRAEHFPWSRTANGFLDVHDLRARARRLQVERTPVG